MIVGKTAQKGSRCTRSKPGTRNPLLCRAGDTEFLHFRLESGPLDP